MRAPPKDFSELPVIQLAAPQRRGENGSGVDGGGRQHGASIRDGVRYIMSAYKEKLDELKKLLMKAEEFSKVYEFFFDSVACHREFIDLGKPSKSELLESALKAGPFSSGHEEPSASSRSKLRALT
jgi:hypothetical protein